MTVKFIKITISLFLISSLFLCYIYYNIDIIVNLYKKDLTALFSNEFEVDLINYSVLSGDFHNGFTFNELKFSEFSRYEVEGDLIVKIRGSAGESNGTSFVIDGKNVHDGKWHSIIFSRTKGGENVLYFDGENLGSRKDTVGQVDNPVDHPVSLGANLEGDQSAGRTYFEGRIDDVRIYNRALSEEEVADLYELEKPKPTNEKVTLETGLIAYYPFNGNANDESGNGNDGTVIGATL